MKSRDEWFQIPGTKNGWTSAPFPSIEDPCWINRQTQQLISKKTFDNRVEYRLEDPCIGANCTGNAYIVCPSEKEAFKMAQLLREIQAKWADNGWVITYA